MNSETIRDLTGAIFLTFAIPTSGQLYIKLTETGQSYHDKAVGRSPVEHGLGPPYLHLWTAMIEVLREKATDQQAKTVQKDYWEGQALKSTREEFAEHVQFMRPRRTPRPSDMQAHRVKAQANLQAKQATQAALPTPPPLEETADDTETDSQHRFMQSRDTHLAPHKILTSDSYCLGKRAAAPRSGMEKARFTSI